MFSTVVGKGNLDSGALIACRSLGCVLIEAHIVEKGIGAHDRVNDQLDITVQN